MTRATLLRAATTVGDHEPAGIVTITRVNADEALFAGHYPDFPIFPGVALVECAHRSVEAAAALRGTGVRLVAVESARFRSPVFPGDRVTTRVTISPADGGWRCNARLQAGGAEVATVRLRYDVGTTGEGRPA